MLLNVLQKKILLPEMLLSRCSCIRSYYLDRSALLIKNARVTAQHAGAALYTDHSCQLGQSWCSCWTRWMYCKSWTEIWCPISGQVIPKIFP